MPASRASHANWKLLETCLQRDVPVLGLCFGGQALATVLGGAVRRLEKPERGWHRIDTDAPGLVGEGPWLQWHYDAFTLPSGAEELARSAACPQAFTSGRNLGTQFHPEATAAIMRRVGPAGPAPRRRSRTGGHGP